MKNKIKESFRSKGGLNNLLILLLTSVIFIGVILSCKNWTSLFSDTTYNIVYGLLFIFFSILISLSIDSRIVSGRWKFPLWNHHRFTDYIPWSSAAWASGLTGVSMQIALWFFQSNDKTDIIASPGFIYAGIALWFVCFTFFNSQVLITHEGQKIAGFKLFLTEVTDILMVWHQNYRSKIKKEFYLVDYTPLIGSISVPNEDEYSYFKEELTGIANKDSIKVEIKIICFNDTKIQKYYEMLHSENLVSGIQKDIKNLELKNTNMNQKVAVWRTSEISPFHFLIAEGIAFQYVIKPTRNGEVNELIGTKTEDVFIIEFLKETYRELESIIATPSSFDYTNPKFIILKFDNEPQENLKGVNIKWEGIADKERTFIDYTESTHSIQIQNNQLKSKIFRVELVKKNDMTSFPSKKRYVEEDEFARRTKK